MARLIFCFFAEDTDIFNGNNLFTATIEQMSAKDASDIDWVFSEIFRAMNTPIHARATSNFRPWADAFPYVNGGLFSGSTETPKFTKIARVGVYELYNINRVKLENLIQRFFDSARFGIQINDRFGNPIVPREWFLVPLFVIDDAISKIKDGSLHQFKYDAKQAKIIEAE